MPQVHQQERQVVAHVDAGDLVVELDRVEERRPAVQQHDVAQVQIAVALPDEPLPAGRRAGAPCTIQRRCAIAVTAAQASGSSTPRPPREAGGVALDDPAMPAPPGRAAARPRGGGGRWQTPAAASGRVAARRGGEPIEEVGLIEAGHLDHPFHRPRGRRAPAQPGSRVTAITPR